MPYVEKGVRESLADGRLPTKPGELNYLVTKLVDSFLVMSGVSYTSLNAVIGVLECAKLELYRRVAAKYEDEKMSDNGDVYIARAKNA